MFSSVSFRSFLTCGRTFAAAALNSFSETVMVLAVSAHLSNFFVYLSRALSPLPCTLSTMARTMY